MLEAIIAFLNLAVLIWVLTRLGKIAEETTRTRAILSILHDYELGEQAKRLREKAEREPDNRKRQKLLDRANIIDEHLRQL